MIESVIKQKGKTYAIVVHSFSRLYRSLNDLALYLPRFREAGITLISVTQIVDDGLIRSFFTNFYALVDETYSAETSKHIKRAMRANALQGCFNGGMPPFGYKIEDATVVGCTGFSKKKKLVTEAEEAAIVNEIFDLNEGIGVPAPLGTKAIVEQLNSKCLCRGYPWKAQKVRRILTDSVYTGVYLFGARATQLSPTSVPRGSDGATTSQREEIPSVPIPVPVLVDKERFLRVAAKRKAFPQKK
jgi:hypothetical protein